MMIAYSLFCASLYIGTSAWAMTPTDSNASSASNRKIKITNQCSSTVWPAILTPKDITSSPVPDQATGWELASGASTEFEVAASWTAGRMWARTGCVVQEGKLRCLTGECADPEGKEGSGSLECLAGGQPPVTLAEFTLSPNGQDNYDISLVDGFNIPMLITPSAPDCPIPECSVNINNLCPAVLRSGLDQTGANLGCAHSCIQGFGQEQYGNRACCSGGYNDPHLCAICGVDYYHVFKDSCPNAYAYAYDEKSDTALFTCPSSSSSDYEIILCPKGTDYVGKATASNEYDNDLATCKDKVTSGEAVPFEIKPSPTEIATIGDIKYTAVPGTGAAEISTRPQVITGGSEATVTADAAGSAAVSKEDGTSTAMPTMTGTSSGEQKVSADVESLPSLLPPATGRVSYSRLPGHHAQNPFRAGRTFGDV